MSGSIIGSKIGGSFKTLLVTQNNNLVFKTDKSEVLIPTGSSIDKWFVFHRPAFPSDHSYYPVLRICPNQMFSIEDTVVYDFKNDETVRSKFWANDENGKWVEYDGSFALNGNETSILCDMSEIAVNDPYFVEWFWVDESDNDFGKTLELFVPHPDGDLGNEN